MLELRWDIFLLYKCVRIETYVMGYKEILGLYSKHRQGYDI